MICNAAVDDGDADSVSRISVLTSGGGIDGLIRIVRRIGRTHATVRGDVANGRVRGQHFRLAGIQPVYGSLRSPQRTLEIAALILDLLQLLFSQRSIELDDHVDIGLRIGVIEVF
jgi:hypothetical protein